MLQPFSLLSGMGQYFLCSRSVWQWQQMIILLSYILIAFTNNMLTPSSMCLNVNLMLVGIQNIIPMLSAKTAHHHLVFYCRDSTIAVGVLGETRHTDP